MRQVLQMEPVRTPTRKRCFLKVILKGMHNCGDQDTLQPPSAGRSTFVAFSWLTFAASTKKYEFLVLIFEVTSPGIRCVLN